MTGKIAVVTGSNQGIGYGIVRELCRRGVGVVYLTARDTKRGLQAVENLKKEGLNPAFHQLDITDKDSVITFAEHLKSKHGGMDILINNAAVASKDWITTYDNYDDAKRVIDVNYRSYFSIMENLFPLLKENARVINISSNCGHITNLKNKYWIEKLTSDNIKVEDIDSFVDWFLDSVKDGSYNDNDFATPLIVPYKVSKVAVCALTWIQQREIGRGISINALHPGFVKTNMTSNIGDLTIEEASQAPVYLALDCDQSVKGKYFWFDKSEVNWADLNFKCMVTCPENVEKIKDMFVKNKQPAKCDADSRMMSSVPLLI